MSGGTLHAIGGGLAGLSAAFRAERRTVLWEASPNFGGRCRSLDDPALGTIDNGNHLVLACNRAAIELMRATGGIDRAIFGEPSLPFVDLSDGARWRFGFERRLWGWRPLLPPDLAASIVPDLVRLWRLPAEAPLADALANSRAYRAFWQPLAVAVVNREPADAAAGGLKRVLREAGLAGPSGLTPVLFPHGLSAALVEPTLRALETRGADLRPGVRVSGLEERDGRVAALHARGQRVELGPGDAVVLALPPKGAASLLPWLDVPEGADAILNAHYLKPAGAAPPDPITGLVGALAEWVFAKERTLSVTVSASGRRPELDGPDAAELLWGDVARALDLPAVPTPPHRLIREKAATWAQSPANERRRPQARTRLANLALAGDWTATGLPATIEGAVRSGVAAVTALRAVR